MITMIIGILVPFLGTSLGAFLVFFMRDKISKRTENVLLGFAGGVMIAGSVWSLIIPAIELSEQLGKLCFFPAVIGIVLGALFMFLLEIIAEKLQENKIKEQNSKMKKTTMLVLTITIHNIPEGMAVGIALAGAYFGNSGVTLTAGLVLSVGIAIQNIPEGAITSMPLKSSGYSKGRAFYFGVLSGIVEPIFACITIIFTSIITPILPYLLAFASGAMICVVVEELIPSSQMDGHGKLATISFVIGFLIMMIFDVALG